MCETCALHYTVLFTLGSLVAACEALFPPNHIVTASLRNVVGVIDSAEFPCGDESVGGAGGGGGK